MFACVFVDVGVFTQNVTILQNVLIIGQGLYRNWQQGWFNYPWQKDFLHGWLVVGCRLHPRQIWRLQCVQPLPGETWFWDWAFIISRLLPPLLSRSPPISIHVIRDMCCFLPLLGCSMLLSLCLFELHWIPQSKAPSVFVRVLRMPMHVKCTYCVNLTHVHEYFNC